MYHLNNIEVININLYEDEDFVLPPILASEPYLCMKTCQRFVLFVPAGQGVAISQAFSRRVDLQLYQQVEAYEFLLSLGSGLQSMILGETQIFSQLKSFLKEHAGAFQAPFIQKLFADIKRVRSQSALSEQKNLYSESLHHLVNLHDKKVWVLGARKFAVGVVDHILRNKDKKPRKLAIWNRNTELSRGWVEENQARYETFLHWVPELRGEHTRETFDVALVFLPPGVEFASSLPLGLGTLVHFGKRNQLVIDTPQLQKTKIYTLDDVFQSSQLIFPERFGRVLQAQQACQDLSRQRWLYHGIQLNQGWEDLQH